ncbi:hypothetical protein Syun_021851 [Stephania yunnanensis]|uniref:Origin of replication complex subunit 4 n=1 Tax=Stephania yunnanensis TaxID=152371 RepID=A0AAP0IGD3_9MAGN
MEQQQTLAVNAQIELRRRLCDRKSIFSIFSESPNSNHSKLKFIVSNSVTEGCNNSVLLLGPRGCGQKEVELRAKVLDLVIEDLKSEHHDLISVVKLDGILHSDDNCALKEIAKQLCLENQLLFSKMASSDDNSQFMIAVLREYGLAHKTVIFVLDEFDLFAQGKQRLLYSLLDAMQSVASQAVVIGASCRLDADQLLEKRVRSRFSHRKLLFLPPNKEDRKRQVFLHSLTWKLHCFTLDSKFPLLLLNIFKDTRFMEVLDALSDYDSSINNLLNFLFVAVCDMALDTGYLSLDNFKTAALSIQRPFKLEIIQGCSILELYILVCMKRLEDKEQNSYNFNSVMKEYKGIHVSYQIPDYYSQNVCLRAFEHLLQRELICFMDNRGHSLSIEFRPVKLLISSYELHQALKSNRFFPALLHKLIS